MDTEKIIQNRISPLEVVGEVVPQNDVVAVNVFPEKPFIKFENPSFKGEDHKTKRTKKHIVNDNLQLKPQSKNFGTYISSGMGKKPANSYMQFFVEFYDSDRDGQRNKCWGNDLQNQVEICKPKVGDSICITSYGLIPLDPEKPHGNKKQIYEMHVL